MANRILRDCTDSEPINQLSFQAEVTFYRLMMKADDYGCFHANPKLVKAALFPLKDVREPDIIRWLGECEKSGLIVSYTTNEKLYLQILNFGQRLRAMRSKYPQYDGSMRSIVSNPQPEVETEEKPKQETETKVNIRSLVFLKPLEHENLRKEYSEEDCNWMYDKLNAYKLSNGKKYKSDYGAILNWVVKSLKEEKQKNQQNGRTGTASHKTNHATATLTDNPNYGGGL